MSDTQSGVRARILLWGISGSGKTTTLHTIHSKLREDLRGELRQEPTRLDPSVHYEALSISLGEVGGVGTQIEVVAVPGASDQSMTRKQLLDEVDGLILVLDCSPERIEENWASIEELKSALEDYGHRLDSFPIVLQYNKRDVADPFAIEELHRRIGLDQSAVFETIATTGHGILATLTTISKHVVRAQRTQAVAEPIAAARVEVDDPNASSSDILEAAILAESDEDDVDDLLDAVELDVLPLKPQPDWQADSGTPNKLGAKMRIVSVGQATTDADRGVRVPLVLGDEAGQTVSLVLTLNLESLLEDGSD